MADEDVDRTRTGALAEAQEVQVTELTAQGAKLDSEQVVAVPALKAV